MQSVRLGLTLIAGLTALFFMAACGDSKPEPTSTPVFSTPTPDSIVEPTATPPASVTPSDIEKAVDKVLQEHRTGISIAELERLIEQELLTVQFPDGVGIDRDDLETMIEERLIPAREALLAANRPASGEEDDNETSTPDVLFRYMGAVNSLYAGQNDEAIPAFDLIIRVHPDMARAYYYRGLAFYRSGYNEEAMADFDKAIDLDPESGDPYLQRGLIHYQNDDRQAAMRDFNSAVDLAPWLADAYRNRGALFLNNGVVGPGLADLDRALQIYEFERNRARFDEVMAILNDPPNEPLQMFTSTDLLPRLP